MSNSNAKGIIRVSPDENLLSYECDVGTYIGYLPMSVSNKTIDSMKSGNFSINMNKNIGSEKFSVEIKNSDNRKISITFLKVFTLEEKHAHTSDFWNEEIYRSRVKIVELLGSINALESRYGVFYNDHAREMKMIVDQFSSSENDRNKSVDELKRAKDELEQCRADRDRFIILTSKAESEIAKITEDADSKIKKLTDECSTLRSGLIRVIQDRDAAIEKSMVMVGRVEKLDQECKTLREIIANLTNPKKPIGLFRRLLCRTKEPRGY